MKDDLNSLIVKEGGRLVEKNVKWLESESAFNNSIRTGIIKNLNHIDPKKFFDDASDLFAIEIKKALNESQCNLKVYTVLEALFVREKGEESVEELKHFNTKTFPIFIASNLKDLFIENVTDPTLRDIDEFQERDSGWRLKRIELLNVIIIKYNPMRHGSFKDLPASIKKKHACINVQNFDNECLKWAVRSALVHLKGYKVSHSHKVSSYRQYEDEFKLSYQGLEFPIQLSNIPKFEKLNNSSINLYILMKS